MRAGRRGRRIDGAGGNDDLFRRATILMMARRPYRSIAWWPRVSLARARRRTRLVAHLTILLCLVDPGFVDLRAAQEMVEQSRWRMAANATVLSVEQEKARAEKPGSDFQECTNGCPAMIVIPAGKFIMGSPDGESDRQPSEGQ